MGRFDECHMGMILAQAFGPRIGIIATMGRPKDQKPVVLRGKSHCGEACSHPMDRSYPPGIGGLAPAEEGPAGLQGDQTVIRRVDEDGGRGNRNIRIRTEADRKPTDTRGRGDEDKGGGRLELRGKGSTARCATSRALRSLDHTLRTTIVFCNNPSGRRSGNGSCRGGCKLNWGRALCNAWYFTPSGLPENPCR